MGSRLRLSVGWLCLLAFLAGCGAPARQESAVRESAARPPAAGPKRITAIIQSVPTTVFNRFNPGQTQAGVDAIEGLLNAGLSTLDSRDELLPQLAEAVPSIESGLWKVFPDGRMETSWTIRPRVEWHDGAPFTSADLAFTAQLGRDREVPVFGDAAFGLIGSVETPDPRTVVVTWTKPYISADRLFSRLLAMPVAKHVLERPYLEEKATFTELPYWYQQFVGTGPFKLREVVEGSHLVMTANDRYVLGRPKIDEIEVRSVPDANTLVTNVLAGSGDLALGPRISLDLAMQARERWTEGTVSIIVQGGMGLNIYPQFINPSPPIVADVRFRRALLHAIDRQVLVDSLLAGLTSIAHSPVNPTDRDYRAVEGAIVRYEYDPGRARQLLEGLGYVKGSDGIFAEAGTRLSFETRAYAQTDIQPKTLTAVADYWQQLGVGVEQLIVPNHLVSDEQYRHTRPAFEVLTVGATGHFTHYHSSRIPQSGNNFFGLNRSRYASPELDGLIDQYLVTVPQQERAQVVSQIVRHWTDQLVTMGMFYTTTHALVSNRVTGVVPRGSISTEVWNAHEWDVR